MAPSTNCIGGTNLIATPSAPPVSASSLSGLQFLGYSMGESDATSATGITIVVASFGALNGHSIDGADLGGPFSADKIAAMHQKGMKVLLSLGGAGGGFHFDGDAQGFESSLKSLVAQLPYDGIDFDDENEGGNGEDLSQRRTNLIALIKAARNALGPAGLVTISAYGDPSYQGDGDVLKDSGVQSAISLVNVMSYAGDDVNATENYTSSYASVIDKKKILLGVDVGGDMGGPPSAASLKTMGEWVRSNGYGGIMMWTLNTDAQTLQAVTSGLGI
jgi:GH18 family chitinase